MAYICYNLIQKEVNSPVDEIIRKNFLFTLLGFLVALVVKNLHANAEEMQETQVQSLGQEDHLELEMETRSSILAWGIPWTKEPGSPWGCKELDMTDCHSIHINLIKRTFNKMLACMFNSYL